MWYKNQNSQYLIRMKYLLKRDLLDQWIFFFQIIAAVWNDLQKMADSVSCISSFQLHFSPYPLPLQIGTLPYNRYFSPRPLYILR